jgi:hypothetical protein
MKLITDTCNARVSAAPDLPCKRPVLLRFGTLTLAMTPTEARELADQLHDQADTAEENQ